jgi:predicted AAA+ superfamily ATPase
MEHDDPLIQRLDRLLEHLEGLLTAGRHPPDWRTAIAWRWHNGLHPVRHTHRIVPDDLLCIDRQKELLVRNTRQFLQGLPANHALLTGSRGTGKSSLVKAMLNAYADQGLRIIEVEGHDLVHLPDIVEPLYGRPERFLLFSDDLSFEAGDPGYKALKAILDGSVLAPPDNVLIYATSNRRHLMPEFMSENRESRVVDGELHHGEAIEEKVSLSDRFGLWLPFHPFSQDQYLQVVAHWLDRLGYRGTLAGDLRQEAIRWATARGSRSGRVAWQFARDVVGRAGVTDDRVRP